MATKKVNGSGEDLREALKKRMLRLDGATGTQIQQYSLTEDDFRQGVFVDSPVPLKGNNECLNLTRPDVIAVVHEAYIEAGADIIETNTFSANRISQTEYGLESHAREMALAGARIARAAADKAPRKVWVAGSIGPTSKSLTLAPDINRPAERPYSFDQMAESYREQVEALLEGGVDLLLIETAFDALNVKAALYAVQQAEDRFLRSARNDRIPVIVSVSVSDRSGRTLTGQTLEAFFTAVRHYPLTALFARGRRAAAAGQGCRRFQRRTGHLLPERGTAERARRVRPDAGGDGGTDGPDGRNHQHRGRLLRHDAGAYPRDSDALPRPVERAS